MVVSTTLSIGSACDSYLLSDLGQVTSPKLFGCTTHVVTLVDIRTRLSGVRVLQSFRLYFEAIFFVN